jgi:hypothetical protein
LWLAANEYGLSEQKYINNNKQSSLAGNKELYILHIQMSISTPLDYSKVPQKGKKIVFWPDLASAHYAKDTLARLEELKSLYTSHQSTKRPKTTTYKTFPWNFDF